MKVRPAVIADLRHLIALFQQQVAYQRQIHPFFDLASDVNWSDFVRAKLKNPYERVFVAERDEQLVGFINVQVSYSPTPRLLRRILGRLLGRNIMPSIVRRPRVGWIEDCYVQPAIRHHGAGSALVQAGLAWLQVQQVRRVELAVYAANSGGLAFWERQGFSPFQLLMSREIN